MDRWKEELLLVQHEMLWTSLWFEYQKNLWEKRAAKSVEPGKNAYAYKQMELWKDFMRKSSIAFQGQQIDCN